LKALDDKYLAIEKEYEKAVQVGGVLGLDGCGRPGKKRRGKTWRVRG